MYFNIFVWICLGRFFVICVLINLGVIVFIVIFFDVNFFVKVLVILIILVFVVL